MNITECSLKMTIWRHIVPKKLQSLPFLADRELRMQEFLLSKEDSHYICKNCGWELMAPAAQPFIQNKGENDSREITYCFHPKGDSNLHPWGVCALCDSICICSNFLFPVIIGQNWTRRFPQDSSQVQDTLFPDFTARHYCFCPLITGLIQICQASFLTPFHLFCR